MLCWLTLVLASSPSLALGQQAVRNIALLPETVQMALSVEGATPLLRGESPLVQALQEWGWAQETRPAFDELAARLGEPAEVAFDRLLGRRATLVIREREGAPHWVVLSEVDRETAKQLPSQLDAKPLRISSTLPVQGLERRSFEFTVSPINPNTGTAWALLGPARASELFDVMVGTIMGAPDGPLPLIKSKHSGLFKGAAMGSIAVFVQQPERSRAVLAWANSDAAGWDVEARAEPATAWLSGIADAEGGATLPALIEPRPEGELAVVWALPWRDQPLLEAFTGSAVGAALWSCVTPLDSPRGVAVYREGDAIGVIVSAQTERPPSALERADAVLESKAGATAFAGELPDAVRTSGCKTAAAFGRVPLESVAWATPPAEVDERRWLVIAASSDADARLAPLVLEHAAMASLLGAVEGERLLTHGRLRPRELLASFLRELAPVPESIGVAGAIESLAWRVAQHGEQLRARLRLDLAEPAAD